MMRHSVLLLATALLVPGPAEAQDSPLLPGARVRILTDSPGTKPVSIIATFVSATEDHVWIRFLEEHGTSDVELARAALTRLDVSRGSRSSWASGLGIGFLSGAGIGALLGRLTLEGDISTRDKALFGAATGGLSGALIGMMIGSSITRDRWEKVPLTAIPVGARLNLRGGQRELQLGMRLGFSSGL